MTLLGLVADIHGDWARFVQAIRLFERAGVQHIICAGDIVDRGADADRIVAVLQQLPITCIKGNHEYTIAQAHARRQASLRVEQLARVGRVVSDATLAFINGLPPTARLTINNTRILVAHGTPWSDVATVFSDSHQALYDRLRREYGTTNDSIVLGHTHRPMHVRKGTLQILNPGSVYGVTARDSHTCGLLLLPEQQFRVVDLDTLEDYPVPVIIRWDRIKVFKSSL